MTVARALAIAAALTLLCVLIFKLGLGIAGADLRPLARRPEMELIFDNICARLFATALSGWNLLYCFIGVLLGTLIGVLPGIGPIATIAMLLPITFTLSPVASLIMLAGIYYGAQYGGSTTAILINLPGEASSAVTAIDGYQMARQGRAGQALAIAAIGSFVAGTVATFVIALVRAAAHRARAQVRLRGIFRARSCSGWSCSVALAHGSVLKAHGDGRRSACCSA